MFKIIKRPPLAERRMFVLRILAVLFAVCASMAIIAFLGHNPFKVMLEMVRGSVGSAYRIKETINKMVPLLTLSLGVCVAYKMKFWNIGAEGQFYMGAYGAGLVAFNFGHLPSFILLPAMFAAGILAGGLWALIPAMLKAKWETSETLVTLMLNYVAIRWITYLQYGPWRDPKAAGLPRMMHFPETADLPKIGSMHIGWIIALILVIVIYILIRYSKLGYEITVMGENPRTAEYAGMNTFRILLIAIMISGGICGIAGVIQATGLEHSISPVLSSGLGFTAIITAWLSKLQPVTLVSVSFLFAMMLQGGSYLQSVMKVPSDVAGVIQGVILFFVLGSEFFTQYKIVRDKPQGEETRKVGA